MKILDVFKRGAQNAGLVESGLTPQQVAAAEQILGRSINYSLSLLGGTTLHSVNNTPIYAAVNLIAGQVGGMLAEQDAWWIENGNGERIGVTEALHVLQNVVDGELSPQAFWESVVSGMLLQGNAVMEILRFGRRDRVGGLKRLNTNSVQCMRDSNGDLVYFEGTRRIEARNILHFRLGAGVAPPGNGTKEGFALSPVRVLRPGIQIAEEVERYILEWFDDENGGLKTKVAILPPSGQSIQADSSKGGKSQLQQLANNLRNYGRRRGPMPLARDFQIEEIKDSPTDSEMAGLMKQQVMDVARIYSIPSALLGIEGGGLGKSSAEASEVKRFFHSYCLQRYVGEMLSEMTDKLAAGRRQFRYNPMYFMRGSPNEISSILSVLTGNSGQHPAVITERELRTLAGLPAEADGEVMETFGSRDGNNAPTTTEPPEDDDD